MTGKKWQIWLFAQLRRAPTRLPLNAFQMNPERLPVTLRKA